MAIWTCKILDFLQYCEMETVATCSTTDGNGSYHRSTPSFFEEMTRFRHQKHCCDNQTTPTVHRNSANIACTFLFYVYLGLRDCDCGSTADGSGSYHAPALSYFEEMTRCRRQKFHWRWPGNPNGRSKSRNLGLFTFTRSQLMLWSGSGSMADGGFRRSLKWHVTDVKNIAGWPGSIDIPQIRKFMPRRSRKTSQKTSFLLLWTTPRFTALRTVFFPAITRNGICLHIRKIISWRPWLPPKIRAIHSVVFCR